MARRWSRKLTYTLHTRDGRTLRTLREAVDYMLAMPESRQLLPAWQSATRLVMEAAETGEVLAATKQIHRALFLDNQLDLARTRLPPK